MSIQAQEVTLQSAGNKLYAKLWATSHDQPGIILLSGLGFHSFEYEDLVANLAKQGFNCLAFDFKGHGQSEGKRGDWTLEELTEDTVCAVGFMTDKCNGKIGLFGNSLGGMVGAYAAAKDNRVSSLAASNCPAHLDRFMLNTPRKIFFFLGKCISHLIPLKISVNHFYSYNQLIDNQKWVDIIANDTSITKARKLSMKVYKSFLIEWDGEKAIRAVHRPVLLMQGKNDHMQPPTEIEALFAAANQPKEKLMLPTGHLPHLEKPKLVADTLTEWFNKTLK